MRAARPNLTEPPPLQPSPPPKSSMQRVVCRRKPASRIVAACSGNVTRPANTFHRHSLSAPAGAKRARSQYRDDDSYPHQEQAGDADCVDEGALAQIVAAGVD